VSSKAKNLRAVAADSASLWGLFLRKPAKRLTDRDGRCLQILRKLFVSYLQSFVKAVGFFHPQPGGLRTREPAGQDATPGPDPARD
jgi:hypothetical protein